MAFPHTSTASSKTSKTTSSKDVDRVRDILEWNGYKMHMDDNATTNCEVWKYAQDIVKNRERHSELNSVALTNLHNIRKEYNKSNELTFIVKFWPAFVTEGRQVEAGGVSGDEICGETQSDRATGDIDETEHECEGVLGSIDTTIWQLESVDDGTAEDPPTWTDQAWDKDFLRSNWNSKFDRWVLPLLDKPKNDRIHNELLAEIETPQPDIAYGLKKEAFTHDEQFINSSCAASQISQHLYHTFFVVDANSFKKNLIDEAENQCCRSGASMVNARRIFNAETGQRSSPGADLTSIAFSLALTPCFGILFVHWAEVVDDKTTFHMSFIESYSLRMRGGIVDMKHDIDNILDWGTLQRKNELKQVCRRIQESRNAGDVQGPHLKNP
ncbi:MAG: hypothetical protein Q9191_006448, partial [Dirinaria sp. TL-2023a]